MVPSQPRSHVQQSWFELQGQSFTVLSLHISELPEIKQPLLTHCCPSLHEQSIVPPQPSEIVPQSFDVHVLGVQQTAWKQTCSCVHVVTQSPVESQVRHSPVGQSPQTSVLSQPSETVPHLPSHVPGVQQPPAPRQTWLGAQVLSQTPQFSMSLRLVQVSPQQIVFGPQHPPAQQAPP